MRLRFANFVLDVQLGRLEDGDGEVHLRPQTFRLLETLVREAPRILSGDELLNLVWGTEHLSENSLRQAISELRQVLGDSASRPTIIETVHRRGYRLIAEVEEEAPKEARPANETDAEPEPMTRGEDPATHSVPDEARSPASRRSGRFLIASLLMVALWVLPHPTAESALPPMRPAIAILELESFAAAGSEISWLAAAVREMLRFELGVAGTARLIGDKEVEWAVRRSGIEDRSALSPEEVRQLGRRLGARWVIHGSYVASLATDGPLDLQILLQISGTETGEVQGWARERGGGDEVLELFQRLLLSVRTHLPVGGVPTPRDTNVQSRLASSAESLKLFAQGVAALSRRDHVEARGFLERAAAIDGDNPLNHSMLASTYLSLGLASLATASAERSAELAQDLPWEHRMSVAARADRIAGRCDQAAKRLLVLQQRIPGDVDYGLRLSGSHHCAGRLEKALEVLRSLRTLPLFGITDLYLDFREIRLLAALHRLDAAEELGLRAIDEALEREAPMLAVDGLIDLFWIRLRQGRWPDAEATLVRLESLIESDEAVRRALLYSLRAVLRHHQGQMAEARGAYEEALALLKQLGDRRIEAAVLNNYAALLNNLGDQDAMAEALSRSIELKREIGERGGLVTSLSNLANVLILKEDPTAAAPLLEEAEILAREIDDLQRLAVLRRSQGRLAEAFGDLEAAEPKYREALALSEQIEDVGGVAWAHRGLGGIFRDRGEWAPAADHLRRAFGYFEESGNIPEAMATRCRLGDLELEAGRFSSARELYSEVLELIEVGDLLIYRAEARQGLARVAESVGELESARQEWLAALDLWLEAGREEEVTEARASLDALEVAGD